jgi:hypothetical protein
MKARHAASIPDPISQGWLLQPQCQCQPADVAATLPWSSWSGMSVYLVSKSSASQP